MPYILVCAAFLIALAIIDYRKKIIPNWILLVALAAVAVYRAIANPVSLKSAFIGLLIALTFYIIIYLTNPKTIGAGDVKMGALIGFMLGFPSVMLAIIIIGIIGGIIGVWLLIKKSNIKKIPYAPVITTGTIAVLIWGDLILRWYFTGMGA